VPVLEAAFLYGILDLKYAAEDSVAEMAGRMIRGGVGVLQLRAKEVDEARIVALGRRLAPICREAGVPFILNDWPHLVGVAGADGVHVGQEDLPVAEARALAGSGAIVGKSTHCLEQAVAAAEEGADYIGFGPLFATPTKPDYVPIGLEMVRDVHARVSLPIFCIGGIKRENLQMVIDAGAVRTVIVSGILCSMEPERYTQECVKILKRGHVWKPAF